MLVPALFQDLWEHGDVSRSRLSLLVDSDPPRCGQYEHHVLVDTVCEANPSQIHQPARAQTPQIFVLLQRFTDLSSMPPMTYSLGPNARNLASVEVPNVVPSIWCNTQQTQETTV